MSFAQFFQYFLAGVSVGSIYAIVALGYNIIYNTTGIINFAQGEFLIVGAMVAITVSSFLPLPLAIVVAVVVATALGATVEIVFIKWLKSPSVLRVIIITIGLSMLLREAMLHIWDEKVRALQHFTGTEISSVAILGARVSPQILWILGISAVIVVALTLFFRFTLIGKAMRACSDNKDAARLCGINARWMVTFSFMLSAAIGALAGCAISPHTQTQYDMGTALAIKGFTVAIVGGLGKAGAAVVAGLMIGLLEAFSISILPLAYQDVVSIAILLVILVFKPSGLFGGQAGSLKEY